MILSYGFAVLAAASNAASNVLQRKANRREPAELSLSPRLILALVQDKVWLAGIVTVIISFVLMTIALSKGQLATVQPIIVLELPMTLIGASIVFHATLHKREWLASGAMTLGLVGLIFFLDPGGGKVSVAWYDWFIGLTALYAVIVALVLVGRRRPTGGKAAIFGTATGLSFGITAVLMKGMTNEFSGGIAGVATAWETYMMVASGIGGMFLLQNALQAGRLVAAQPGITLVDPLIAILWGALVFHERIRMGVYPALAALSGLLIVAGAVALARSPLFTGQSEEPEYDLRGTEHLVLQNEVSAADKP